MKNVLILIGRGKSTLTNNFLNGHIIVYGIEKLIKEADSIKKDIELGSTYVIHLEADEHYAKVPPGIKKRAYKFYINF